MLPFVTFIIFLFFNPRSCVPTLAFTILIKPSSLVARLLLVRKQHFM